MGVEDGVEKRGQLIDLNQKRKERDLKEIKPEDAQKTLRIFSEETVREFEEKYETNDAVVHYHLGRANSYKDKDIEVMLTRAASNIEHYNETLLYAVCRVYQERLRHRRE